MNSDSFGRVILVIVLLALGLGGLFMSACGGLFLFMELFQGEMTGVWVIALPSLLVGLGASWGALAGFRRLAARRAAAGGAAPGGSAPAADSGNRAD